MPEPAFRFRPFLQLLTIAFAVAIGSLFLNWQFDITFQTIASTVEWAAGAILIAWLIYVYVTDRQMFKKLLSPRSAPTPREITDREKQWEMLLHEHTATQRMEQELERLLAQSEKDNTAR